MHSNYFKHSLFIRPSVSEGIARLLDIGATLQEYNSISTPEEADTGALATDWNAVGDDIRDALYLYGKEF